MDCFGGRLLRLLCELAAYAVHALAISRRIEINTLVLKKANPLKGGDAKLPVYGIFLRQRGRRIPDRDFMVPAP